MNGMSRDRQQRMILKENAFVARLAMATFAVLTASVCFADFMQTERVKWALAIKEDNVKVDAQP